MDILETLGLQGRRVVIVHHDDLGNLHAANEAFRSLTDYPTGSIMMPTAWATEWAGETRYDLGVHLTLTSEFAGVRWHPLTAGPSLRDEQGCFWRSNEAAWRAIRSEEAEAELRAQIDAALALGIDVTHIDTHMGSVLRSDLAEIYHRLAIEYRLPAFLPPVEVVAKWGLAEPVLTALADLIARSPLPKLGEFSTYGMPTRGGTRRLLETLRSLQPGLYHFVHHAALPTAEARTLPDWRRRAADVQVLQHPEVRRALLEECTPLTYRQLREALRAVL